MNLVVVFVVLLLVVVGVVGDIRLSRVVAEVDAEHSAECDGGEDADDGCQRQHQSNHHSGKVDSTQRIQDYYNIASTLQHLSTNSQQSDLCSR